MKKFLFVFFTCFSIFALVGCSSSKTTQKKNSYEAKKINVEYVKPKEEVISSFSTNILDKSSGRQTNISITCSTLNGTIVKSGEVFSFCDTVGKATPDRGYQKAKIFDANGNIIMGYGGGNCQVSSTLYNAVLKTSLEVVERHPHSNHVYYVEERKRCSCCLW